MQRTKYLLCLPIAMSLGTWHSTYFNNLSLQISGFKIYEPRWSTIWIHLDSSIPIWKPPSGHMHWSAHLHLPSWKSRPQITGHDRPTIRFQWTAKISKPRYPNKKRVHRQGTGTSCFKILNACARHYLTSYGFMVSTWFLFRPLLKQAHLGVEIIQLGAPVPGVQLWKDSILDIPTSLSGLSIGPYTINLFKSSIINKTKCKT